MVMWSIWSSMQQLQLLTCTEDGVNEREQNEHTTGTFQQNVYQEVKEFFNMLER